jgi:hypothetical protein
MRWIGGSLAILGGVAALAAAAAPAPACGCGIALDAQGASERAYVAFDAGREDLVVSLGLKAQSHAAVVLPVPSTPTVGLAPAGRELFTYLRRSTGPKIVYVHSNAPPPVSSLPGGGSGPVVVGTKSIGGYTITRLRGGTSATLLAWLNAHQYTLPVKAQPILGYYVKSGWSFVAIRLNRQARGLLQPLRLRFRTPSPVYPLRLGQLSETAITLDVWTVGAHRMRATSLSTDFAGPLAPIRAAAPAAVRRYLGGAWITHLYSDFLAPEQMHRDLLPVAASHDTPYRRVDTRFIYGGTSAARRPTGGG